MKFLIPLILVLTVAFGTQVAQADHDFAARQRAIQQHNFAVARQRALARQRAVARQKAIARQRAINAAILQRQAFGHHDVFGRRNVFGNRRFRRSNRVFFVPQSFGFGRTPLILNFGH